MCPVVRGETYLKLRGYDHFEISECILGLVCIAVVAIVSAYLNLRRYANV